jgi:hypothetical protein
MNAVAATAVVLADERTRERWDGFLESIKAGASLPDAMLTAGITSREFEMLAMNDGAKWDEACVIGKKSKFSAIHRDEVFARIAAGTKIEQALIEVRGAVDPTFFELVEADQDWGARYARAMRIRALGESDKLLGLVDDMSRDILHQDKGPAGNMAAVTRDKLRYEARKDLMAWGYPLLYGEKGGPQVNVQINLDHASRLEEARQRATNRDSVPNISSKQLRNAIDAIVIEAPAPGPASIPKIEEPAETNPYAWLTEDDAPAPSLPVTKEPEAETTEEENPWGALEE